MLFKLLIMVMATMAYGKDDFKALYKNTCDLSSQWSLISHMNQSVNYVLQGETNTVSLDSDCESRLEKAMSSCLVDSPKECISFNFSWDALHHERRQINEPRRPRSLTVQRSDNCYCVVQATSTTNEAAQSTSTSDGDTLAASSSSLSGQDTSQTSGIWTRVTSGSPVVSAATSSRSRTTTVSPSPGPESVCIIKIGELNATPQGECYCFNGTRRRYQTGLCDVYS